MTRLAWNSIALGTLAACAGCVGAGDALYSRTDAARDAETRALAAAATIAPDSQLAREVSPPPTRRQLAYAPGDGTAPSETAAPASPWVVRGQSPGGEEYSRTPLAPSGYPIQPAQYTQPAAAPPAAAGFGPPPLAAQPGGEALPPGVAPAPIVGAPDPSIAPYPGPNPFTNPPGGLGRFDGLEPPLPGTTTDLEILLREAQTGRFMIGVGVNSNAGVVGNIVVDERNFDWQRFPNSVDELLNGVAFRGAGQGFRLEAMPGTQVQRYMASFTEPYLWDTAVSLRLSAFYYTRSYFDWNEQRIGGRVEFGYRLTPDTSAAVALRYENVDIFEPRVIGVPELDAALGKSDLFGARLSITHDTRDNAFSPTDGYYLQLGYEQVFGTFDFPQAEIDYRRYFLISERPDGSGRHTLGLTGRVGVSGSQTPIFENFFAGGFSTLRGFAFRGASPIDMGVRVGGRFQFLGSAEYIFPLTADDMMKGVLFCDFGTVEQEIEIQGDNFRVALGAGLRITVPAMGPAPIALDFGFPVAQADGDETQVFSFFVGLNR